MSSLARLAPGQTFAGARWDYRIVDTIKGDDSHQSTIYKAEVLPRTDVPDSPQWATIKTASSENAFVMRGMERERAAYRLPGVSSAACFRKLYDEIDDCTLACEWLETTLGDVKYRPGMRTFALIKACLDAALTSCVVLDGQGHVNTDFKPVNILLSGIETSQITAKVGDLGLVFPTGQRIDVQPFAMRAPEVFLRRPCTEPAPVWAIAAMLLVWIKPGILGVQDTPHPIINAAWSMAKIKRLFPDWALPTPEEVNGPVLQVAVRSASRISREEEPMLAISPLQEEMRKMEMPQELMDLISFIMVPDPDKRPSAAAVLASNEYRAFEKVLDA